MKFALLGNPVLHSKSPPLFAAAFREANLEGTYETLLTRDHELPSRLSALREGSYAGYNVTIPHKSRVLALAHEETPMCKMTGAANVLCMRGGSIVADNTDVPALANELQKLGAKDGVALVLGDGGAARAAVCALVHILGVRAVRVRARGWADPQRKDAFGRDMRRRLMPHPFTLSLESWMPDPIVDRETTVVVQATSLGMQHNPAGETGYPIAWGALPQEAVLLDVVTRRTPFADRASELGLRCATGEGMLVEQAALAWERWLDMPAPRDAMRRALLP